MTKTPDEIKKGLECCCDLMGVMCPYCPYAEDGDASETCREEMADDAFALTQQLESDKQQLEGLCSHMNQLRDAAAERALKMEERVQQLQAENAEQAERIKQLEDHLREATKKIKQLEAERDAALTFMEKECYYCKWNFSEHPDCPCLDCDGESHFEWRGVQKEE